MSKKGFEGFMEMSQEAAKNQYGADFNTASTGDWYKVVTPIILLANYLEDKIYSIKAGMNIFTAVGTQLDDNLTNDLFFRKQGARATGEAEVIGEKGIEIQANTIVVKGTNGLTYTNTTSGKTTNETLKLKFECMEIGSQGNLKADNFLSVVKAPIGIRNVKNYEITEGLDQEDDYNYLKRYLANTEVLAWELGTILSEIKKLQGVISADGVRNNTMTDGLNGIPKKSIRVVVKGGNEQEIAETIYKNIHTPDTVGEIEKEITTSAGTTELIRFDRPLTVKIDYKYNIISSRKEEILQLLEEYLNSAGIGEFISTEEFRRKKLLYIDSSEIKVLTISYKKESENNFQDFLKLNYDEEGAAGIGETL